MDQAYDRKFEEMKKYIPFLESMINRLENTSSTKNPRQAQLDKIRSLRDLLLDKKKRMKMENLLKCEQVLVNLYSKVEQKDALPGLKSLPETAFTNRSSSSKEDPAELEAVRSKLKNVTTKIHEEQDTLPEIARASAIEEQCTPGSKEPALFQRRPNKTSPDKSVLSKRNYTRVLVSPEPGKRRWVKDEQNSGSHLFSRRSPKSSPNKISPTHHKKDKKRSSKQGQFRKAKDVNITLNVPEDSLDSLNTKDILKRIMNCSDNDVDIESLREAKRQILSELKGTGAKCDDISDLLLKSYKKKNTKSKKTEVEEGELSDSESEAIQNIYGNFILEKDDSALSNSQNQNSTDTPRKFQICLVINPDENQSGDATIDAPRALKDSDVTDFEMYDKKAVISVKEDDKVSIEQESNTVTSQITLDNEEKKEIDTGDVSRNVENVKTNVEIGQPANFYKSAKEQDSTKISDESTDVKDNEICNDNALAGMEQERNLSFPSVSDIKAPGDLKDFPNESQEGVEIPLLNDPCITTQIPKEDVVSEIDILQALKNEILSESLSITGSGSTPPLHQPKITKVSSVQEIVPKKRISIEKYKKKTVVEPAKTSIFINDFNNSIKDDVSKKQSLKLTEKECERFNFPTKLSFDDDESDDDTNKDLSLDNLYRNLAPKSPDHKDIHKTNSVPPVIIPVDPVKQTVTSTKADVDMRMFIPMMSPNVLNSPAYTENSKVDININPDKMRSHVDPRVKRDYTQSVNFDNLNVFNPERGRPVVTPMNFPNLNPAIIPNIRPSMTPIISPNMTSNMSSIPPNIPPSINPCMTPTMVPRMTPNRNPNMTPNARTYEMVDRKSFEIDDNSARKHVYAPMFSQYDQREGREKSVAREQEHKPYWDRPDKDVDTRKHTQWENAETSERDPQPKSIQRDGHEFRKSRYNTDSYNYDNQTSRYKYDTRDSFNRSDSSQIPYNRTDCPSTPSHPFGLGDNSGTRINTFSRTGCPSTPSHQFGRSDCPLTPNHPFGRSDCPSTPIHPFGRSDCPSTPIHPFGRSDCPSTPIHPFGRSELPKTPSHSFGRSEHQSRDPRLNRSSDYDYSLSDDRDRHHYRDNKKSNYNNYNKSDSLRTYREKSIGRNERSDYSSSSNHYQNRDKTNTRDDCYSASSDNIGHKSNVYRSRSVCRSEINDRSSSKAPSSNSKYDDTGNTLSVTPHVGRSFTIDTSINSTFQDFLDKDNKNKHNIFDRNKRAASVGRTLGREPRDSKTFIRESSIGQSFCRESSVGRSHPHKSEHSKHSFDEQNNFRRARSMGREIFDPKSEQSFKDIKADLRQYKHTYDSKQSLRETRDIGIAKPNLNSNIKESNQRDKVPTKDIHDITSKKPIPSVKKYSDSKGYMESDNHNRKKDLHKQRDLKKEHSKNVGIVYSNDNITKGKILGSGYGVKNYKIPKIKRPVEEKLVIEDDEKKDALKTIKEKSKEKQSSKCSLAKSNVNNVKSNVTKLVKSEIKTESCKKIVKYPSKVANTDDSVKTEKRITRQSRKSALSDVTDDENVGKLRKPKKTFVYHSDSDTELDKVDESKNDVKLTGDDNKSNTFVATNVIQENESILINDASLKMSPESFQPAGNSKDDENISKNDQEMFEIANELSSESKNNLDSSFGIDDYEIFSDNIASDSVIDNINTLIANLDSDLEPSKSIATDFTNNTLFDQMLENIDSDEDDSNLNSPPVISNDISDSVVTDLQESENKQINISYFADKTDKYDESLKETTDGKCVIATESTILSSQENDAKPNKDILTSDDLVSTTGIEKEKLLEEVETIATEQNLDSVSTPDSTNEIVQNKTETEGSIPDSSTNEFQNNSNTMVSSSHDSSETNPKENDPSFSASNETMPMDSIGNIISLLQNKSKLKEILNMLGDNSNENEKIKKKLEKLSEIVSDEDEEAETSKDKQENSLDCAKENTLTDSGKNMNIVPDNNTEETDSNESNDNFKIEEPEDGNEELKKESNKFVKTKKVTIKKGKVTRKGKGRLNKKIPPKGLKRITRSEAKEKTKKPSRELLKLQEDIENNFMKDDILNATGIRMCRIAKLVDDKTSKLKEDSINQDISALSAVLQKQKESETIDDAQSPEKNTKKKVGPKKKTKSTESMNTLNNSSSLKTPTYKPGPKSKTKGLHKSDEEDPYSFESDSVSEINFSTKLIEDKEVESSASEDESVTSSKSCESSELLVEIKKKTKRKRSSWQSGIIKMKSRKKKLETKQPDISTDHEHSQLQKNITILDLKCFTDKAYCFHPNIFTYSCRLCIYSGDDIVNHYKQNHPHSEIPLSRPSPEMAKQAIQQCNEVNFQAISKMPSDKYTCRFCYKEFGKKVGALEAFFWHVVSMHTGEYKHPSTSTNNLDIPPPPKDIKGQLIGYICEKCNFTQISLENLKTHVIVRHNDEQTEVYTINLAVMSSKAIHILTKRCNAESEQLQQQRVLRSNRSNKSVNETSDDHTDSDVPNTPSKESVPPPDKPLTVKYQSKITFEYDDNTSETSSVAESFPIKLENQETIESKQTEIERTDETNVSDAKTDRPITPNKRSIEGEDPVDIYVHPHFKITYTEGGSKEYVCCINGHDYHYKTTLLISFKKHVQLKHSEIWDGYCSMCKVIVTPQGKFKFKDCLQHYLDKHMDNFPVLEPQKKPDEIVKQDDEDPPAVILPKPYINVRPLSELMSEDKEPELPALPKIENVMSLDPDAAPAPEPVPTTVQPIKEYKYEEAQAEVIAKKHFVVLSTMMSQVKLVNIYKCAGRFCSFSSDSAEDALLHASTHQRIGGENALVCSYCDFDCSGNAIDLVMHVFKSHSVCSYACGHCFYRAASSQVVAAHISRMHSGKPVTVLTATNVTPPQFKASSMLSREAVVQYYVCPHACKFRTYTAGKYCEHILQRHSMVSNHPCYICSEPFPTPAQLINHMKSHNLNLYQCTWCPHGADSESGLLFHTSQRHPDQQPQAYLRVITNKDGSSEYRVLPLASFNKTKIAALPVATSGTNENPVREAERSIELEKLIGHTTQLIQSAETTVVEAEPEAEAIDLEEDDAAVDMVAEEEEQLHNDSDITEDIRLEEPSVEEQPVVPLEKNPPLTSPRVRTPSVTPRPPSVDRSEMTTPVLKQELDDVTLVKYSADEIVCLDSDEDEPVVPAPVAPAHAPAPVVAPAVTPVPGDVPALVPIVAPALAPAPSVAPELAPASGQIKIRHVPQTKLLHCPKCLVSYKAVHSFKKHVMWCCPAEEVRCIHCPLIVSSGEELLGHYLQGHAAARRPNLCVECGLRFDSVPLAKRHIKYSHGCSRTTVTVRCTPDGEDEVLVAPVGRKRPATTPATPPPPKMARYGPQDAHRLPINPILDEAVFCAVCEFKTKVRLNMVRHLQLHAERQPAPSTVPVNPVPHLETNEMHFDRMLNLASSSIALRPPGASTGAKGASAGATGANEGATLGAEAAARYPRQVSERQRLACGALGCSYISLDETMLRRHWDALHAGSNDFRCVHCPPYQHLDTSKPLTAARIVAHLKMHDAALYACSGCAFYHYRRAIVEKHAADTHGGDARTLVVREPPAASPLAPAPAPPPALAPTMDLKPWRCGLCAFQSMLRPAVVEHCARAHASKMQFKCMYCPFRTSACENVVKHQANAHSGKPPDVFYYYYREGSVPDQPDGTPRWTWQREKTACPDAVPDIKSELAPEPPTEVPGPAASQPPPLLDLNLVKREVDTEVTDVGLEQLCAQYGQLGMPNGLKFKCPLCAVVAEEAREAMQSHLYEELKCRRWACAICSYKGFHKAGLNEHILSEHRGQKQQPTLLPVDASIEKWVQAVLDHQHEAIRQNRESFNRQQMAVERPVPSSSTTEDSVIIGTRPQEKALEKHSMKELEQAFGQLGQPSNMAFCCPKCSFKAKEEGVMRDHLEAELSKIRWCCSSCADKFTTYHEAQFHCKSVHAGGMPAARPVEAAREAGIRAAWVAAVLQVQRLSMRCLPLTDLTQAQDLTSSHPADNSLLVVRYEESCSVREPILEDARRKRPAQADSDDEKLVIDELASLASPPAKKKCGCPYCDFTSKYPNCIKEHIYRHYDMKPFVCPHCDYTGHRYKIVQHIEMEHEFEKPATIRYAPMPTGPPPLMTVLKPVKAKRLTEDEGPKMVCLVCEKSLSETEVESHSHDKEEAQFASKGEIVVKCCICLALRRTLISLKEHHDAAHGSQPLNYAFFKLRQTTRDVHCCSHCDKRFTYIKDIRTHHDAVHPSLTLKYHNVPYSNIPIDFEDDNEEGKRCSTESAAPGVKRSVARKSTSKLPSRTVARKSTTRLPFDEESEYSYYGTKPLPLEVYSAVTTSMYFYNTMVPFNLKKLSELIKIDPVVLVEDVAKRGRSD